MLTDDDRAQLAELATLPITMRLELLEAHAARMMRTMENLVATLGELADTLGLHVQTHGLTTSTPGCGNVGCDGCAGCV